MKGLWMAGAWQALRFFGPAVLALYALLVGIGFATEGPRYYFKFDPHAPLYSIRRLLVGLGVRLTAWALRITQTLLSPLYEASAEVGEWITQRTSPETRARLRSRFI